MNLKSVISSRLLLMLSLTVPAAFLSAASGAVAQQATQPGIVTASQKVQPFITAQVRRDTLQNLHNTKLSPIFQGSDGGKGKDASDKGKDSSDKGKDACDSCPDGGLYKGIRESNPRPDEQPILNQPGRIVPSTVLLKGSQIR
ncbi:hypothetical protein [Calothrix sp. PCC 7507]|uniref:hypothetical protein n=1 Tax=Calothrix sp. PCC 7507 TaxID=99598 RepID=UPI00029F24AF|nr:hypothetical protein [Calothrix sp. PCC 7507]AFY31476.1 hypothetical protein Cal7507_0998 [Calothrix sp. PCC 7507]